MVKPFTLEHYSEVHGWWEAHGWAPIALDSLPSTGFIVEGVCAGFLYSTDSNMCILEWVISNPNASKEARSEGLDDLIDALLKAAHDKKYKMVFTSVSHPKLMKRYTEFGFKKTESEMTNMLKVL
jgi:hypothetical protein